MYRSRGLPERRVTRRHGRPGAEPDRGWAGCSQLKRLRRGLGHSPGRGCRRTLALLPPAARGLWAPPHPSGCGASSGTAFALSSPRSTATTRRNRRSRRQRAAQRGDAPADLDETMPSPRSPAGLHRRRWRPAPRTAPPASSSPWPMPPRDLLTAAPAPEVSAQDSAARAKLIVDTLASFGVDVRVVSVNQGPTVTQFQHRARLGGEDTHGARAGRDRPPRSTAASRPKTHTRRVSRTRVRVDQITNLANDLALALAAPSIHIEAPVPSRPVVELEVPNTNAAVVTLRSVIESAQFQRVGAKSRLALALGQGVSGEVVVADLARMPHLLIAGATGSGKSVCINGIIAGVLRAAPRPPRYAS
ncbi:MAG: DNA translocase FtsK [Dehalococcoidia bacterium]